MFFEHTLFQGSHAYTQPKFFTNFFLFRGEHEYELVLRTDMYTNRHTQWYYFRLQKAKQNRTYKFNIINFLKKDSLYNYGKLLPFNDRPVGLVVRNIAIGATGRLVLGSIP